MKTLRIIIAAHINDFQSICVSIVDGFHELAAELKFDSYRCRRLDLHAPKYVAIGVITENKDP